jgi:hypothetical protein
MIVRIPEGPSPDGPELVIQFHTEFRPLWTGALRIIGVSRYYNGFTLPRHHHNPHLHEPNQESQHTAKNLDRSQLTRGDLID